MSTSVIFPVQMHTSQTSFHVISGTLLATSHILSGNCHISALYLFIYKNNVKNKQLKCSVAQSTSVVQKKQMRII